MEYKKFGNTLIVRLDRERKWWTGSWSWPAGSTSPWRQ